MVMMTLSLLFLAIPMIVLVVTYPNVSLETALSAQIAFQLSNLLLAIIFYELIRKKYFYNLRKSIRRSSDINDSVVGLIED